MTPSKALFWFCFAFIVGIFLQSVVKIPQSFIWGILFFGTAIIFISFWSIKFSDFNFKIWGFCTLFLLLGILNLQITEFNIEQHKLKKINNSSEKITLTGQVIDEPDIVGRVQRLKVLVTDYESTILLTVSRYPEYNYLDKVKFTGYLKTPEIIGSFNYKNYLLKDGIYFVMDFPKIELVTKEHDYNIFSFLYEKILFFKSKLKSSIDFNFSSPQNFIIQGILLGNDKNTPKDLKEKFNVTGLSHITAVSGGNIVILINLLVPFLLILGFWRGQAFYFSIVFIWIYILLTGLPVSGIRAAIMGSVFLLAEKIGRQNSSSRIIIITATIMLIKNPLLLLYDIGFQLSFLASMGIIHLKPIIDSLIKLKKEEQAFLNHNTSQESWAGKFRNFIYQRLNYLLDIVSVTISAQIFVLPIIVYNFGSVSIVAPLTNLLILPIIPYLMIFGFASVSLGMFSNFLGWVFYLPCFIMLEYFLFIIDTFYTSWSVKMITDISVIWLLVYYIILSILVWYFNQRLMKMLKF